MAQKLIPTGPALSAEPKRWPKLPLSQVSLRAIPRGRAMGHPTRLRRQARMPVKLQIGSADKMGAAASPKWPHGGPKVTLWVNTQGPEGIGSADKKLCRFRVPTKLGGCFALVSPEAIPRTRGVSF